MYLAAADGIMNVNLQDWWKKNCHIGPEVSEKCCCAQPSSAAVERVFGLLKNPFRDEQTNSLEDK